MTDQTSAPRRRPMWAMGAGILALALAAAACTPGAETTPDPGGTTPDPGVGTPAAPGVETPAAPGVETPEVTPGDAAGEATADDPCSLVTAEEASALVGQDVTGEAVEFADSNTCRFVPGEAGATGFMTVTVFQNVDADAFADAMENFALVEVGTVGDTAAAIDGTLVFQSGANLFSLVAAGANFQPVPQDQLIELGQTVVERLGGENVPMAPETPDAGEGESPTPSP
jgi:hypothetical protein